MPFSCPSCSSIVLFPHDSCLRHLSVFVMFLILCPCDFVPRPSSFCCFTQCLVLSMCLKCLAKNSVLSSQVSTYLFVSFLSLCVVPSSLLPFKFHRLLTASVAIVTLL